MKKRMRKAAVSLVLAAAMAVWTPPAGGASLAASGGTASEGNLGGVSFSGTASEGNREGAVSGGTSSDGNLGGVSFSGTASDGNPGGAVSGGTSMEGELPEEGAVDGAPGKGTAAERGVPGGHLRVRRNRERHPGRAFRAMLWEMKGTSLEALQRGKEAGVRRPEM